MEKIKNNFLKKSFLALMLFVFSASINYSPLFGGKPKVTSPISKLDIKENHMCHICKKLCKSDKALKCHIPKAHPTATGFQPFLMNATETQGNHTCVKCNIHFPSYKCLKSHINRIHKTDIFCRYKYCYKIYDNQEELEQHVKENHMEEGICPLCGFNSESDVSFTIHRRQAHPENPELKPIILSTSAKELEHVCTVCNAPQKSYKNLKEHMRKFHPEEIYCHYQHCYKTFETQEKLELHIKENHISKDELICLKCGYNDESIMKFKIHATKQHPGLTLKDIMLLTKISCRYDSCKQEFKTALDLTDHIAQEHQEETVCQKCGKNFTSIKGLKNHIASYHTSDISDVSEQGIQDQIEETLDLQGITYTQNNFMEMEPEVGPPSLKQEADQPHDGSILYPIAQENLEPLLVAPPIYCDTCYQIFPDEESLQSHICPKW